MNKKQTNKMYGWKAVKNVLSTNRAIWEGLPAFSRTVDAFMDSWREVNRNGEIQDQGTGWATAGKNALRARGIQMALRAAGNLKAWAGDHDEGKVMTIVDFSKSELDHEADPDLSRIFDRIIDLSEERLEVLADYGTNKEFLAAFKEVSAGFGEGVATPKSERSGRRTATGNIAAAIRSGNRALDRLDALVLNFSESHPDFVTTYKHARIAVHNGERHVKAEDNGKAEAA